MLRFVKKTSKKVGLSPGTLVHVGEKKTESVRIRIIDYDQENLEEKDLDKIEECFPYKDTPTVTWINIDGLHEVDVIEKIGKNFSLHPLVLEDIVHTDQRSKMDDFEDYLVIILKMLFYNEERNQIEAEQRLAGRPQNSKKLIRLKENPSQEQLSRSSQFFPIHIKLRI